MSRPISLTIHVDALRHNLNIAKRYAGTNKVFAVVKANAYGHGIENCYAALKGADGFALLEISEALKLRNLGWSSEILLLEGIFTPNDLTLCEQYDLTIVIHSFQQIEWLSNYEGKYKFNIFLKLNSGMNRLGFKGEEYKAAWNMLQKLNCIKNIVHTTHFSDADGERLELDGIEYQYKEFQQIIHKLPGKTSVCNSAALLRHSQKLSSDYCRAGIMLYGCSPDYPKHSIDQWDLQPTMTLKSEIISIQHVKAGETIGYGSTFIAKQNMQIGIVACGYADGYPRSCPSGTPILVDGHLTQTIGRVSMDMLCVDLTNLRNPYIGTEVIMWGRSSNGNILPIEVVAQAAGTIGYELMCKITARVPVKMKGEQLMPNPNIQRLNSTNVMSSTTIHNGIVYLSGQVPKIDSNCIKAQTLNVLDTIDSLLIQANSNRNNILNAQIFLKNIEDFSVFNEIGIDWLNGYEKPSRATIQAVLANPKWLIEIAITATQQ